MRLASIRRNISRKGITSKFDAKSALSIFGAVFSLWFVGWKNVLPWESDWLLPSAARLDHAVSHLNWEFFRQAPLMQWPLVKLPSSGLGWDSVYVPFAAGSLFGFPLRYVEVLLPEKFQFMGLWLVFSFAMLGYWSGRLVALLTERRDVVLLGGALLFFSPTMFYRVGILGHFELSAHWLLLWSFVLYFGGQRNLFQWICLLVIGLLVNVYLFAMLFGVFFASVVMMAVVERRRSDAVRRILYGTLSSLLGLWIFGFFVYSSNAQGLGFFRSNGAAFIYPLYSVGDTYSGSFSWLISRSGIFRDRPFIAFEREGFNFIGLGVLLGLVLGVLLVMKKFRTITRSSVTRAVPLVLVAGTFFLNSLSDRIAVGRRELLSFPIPASVLELRQIFRTAERFTWPLYYLLFLFVIWSVIRLIENKRFSIVLLSLILAVQIVDTSGGVVRAHQAMSAESPMIQLNVQKWKQVALQKKSIFLVPTFDFIGDEQSAEIDAWRENYRFFPLLQFAAQQGLSTNFAVTGRPVSRLVDRLNREMNQKFETSEIDESVIYVFVLADEWNDLKMKFGSEVRFEKLDGYYLLYSDPVDDGESG